MVYPTEDFFLFPFLRPCKFYVTSAFKKLRKDLKFKSKHKEIFENLNVESVRNVFEDGIFKYLPLPDKHGRRVLFVQCGSEYLKGKFTYYAFIGGGRGGFEIYYDLLYSALILLFEK